MLPNYLTEDKYPMIKKYFLSIFLSLVFVSSMQAANMQYLRYSPVSHFTAKDFELLNTTSHNALEKNADEQTSEWKNSDSNNSGSITPLNTEIIDGNTCRKVKIVNQAQNQFGESVFTFCKINNEWKILK
jgi:surface antigen